MEQVARRHVPCLAREPFRLGLRRSSLGAPGRIPRPVVDHASEDALDVAVVERAGHLHPGQAHDDVGPPEVFGAVQPDQRGQVLVVALDLLPIGVVHAGPPDARTSAPPSKMSTGSTAVTTKFGASTISLTFRSTATLHSA